MLLLKSCLTRYRHSQFVSLANSYNFCRRTCHTSSPPVRRLRPRKDASASAIAANKPSIEPWVQPYSLRQTLEQHRAANRSGEAWNGYPLQPSGTHKHDPKNSIHSGKQERYKGFKRLQAPGAITNLVSYPGVSVSLLSNWAIKGNLPEALRRPWIRVLEQQNEHHRNMQASQRLSAEILAYGGYASPTPLERDAAQQVVKDVRDILAKIPDCADLRIALIGSRTTGLDHPLSDIDFYISDSGTDQPTRIEALRTLRNICKAVRKAKSQQPPSSMLAIQTFRQGRVPLVDCRHLNSGLNVQMQLTGEDFAATEITKAYLAEHRNLDPLFRFIKQMLNMRGLTDGVRGGVTSYPLFHMIAASLKLGSPPKQDLGSQLLHFLDFWAELDLSATAIEYYRQNDGSASSPHNTKAAFGYDPFACRPRLVPRNAINDPSSFRLQDPANLSNNLGKDRFLIKHVQATFIDAREQIRNSMGKWDEMYGRGLDMKLNGFPILTWCLEGDYSHVEEMRQQLRASLISEQCSSGE